MFEVQVGAVDVTIYVLFVDDDGGTAPGEPTTGLLFSNIETGGSASTMRQGAARADFTLVTVAVAAAHTDGGFIEVDAINMPGVYRLDLPDVFATGADFVIAQLVEAGANNTLMRPVVINISENPSVNVAQYLGAAAPALISSRYPSQVAGMEAAVLTAAAIAANAIEAGKINANALDDKGNWNVGKTGYTAAPTAASIIAASFGVGAIDAAALAADAITKIRSIVNGTSDAGGSTTVLRDAARTEADDTHIGDWLLLTSGSDSGRCRLITEFVNSTGDITFIPAVSTAIGAGITYEILPNAGVDVQSWVGVEGNLVAPNALVSGRVDGSVGAMAAAVLDATAIAADAITAAKIAAGAIAKGDQLTGLNDLNAAAVNAEMVDVIFTDILAELTQAIPAANPSVATALMLIYMTLRNKLDTSGTLFEVHADDGTQIATKALTDIAGTSSEAKMIAGT